MGKTRCHVKGTFFVGSNAMANRPHINDNSAKTGIVKKLLLTIRAVMLEKHVDLVAGDFNRAAWRRQC